MNRFLVVLFSFLLTFHSHADPLRVFIRGGKKSHGPNAHEHERFLADWKVLLGERGIAVSGAMDWPNAEQIKATDVIVAYAQEGGGATPEQEKLIEEFTRRGGGIVVIHTASVSRTNPVWWKGIIGGAWIQEKTKWSEGMINIYYQDKDHPITREASNFYIDDEIYFDMDLDPAIHVLATSYTSNVPDGKSKPANGKPHVYDIQPQMWTYEKTAPGGSQPYRAFVGIPGHLYSTFEKPFYRAILLRAIAWTGKRSDTDEFCKPEELASLRYPEGGPSKPADELAKLEVHPDFTMKLVASEPLISKPINFNWDADGRLWVAETPEYPNGKRGMRPDYRGKEWKDHGGLFPEPGPQVRNGQDKISILRDTDGDGVMDAKQVFAEGLDLVTGFVFYKDGVIATQAPDVLFLRDTDGDGKSDTVEKLYSNLGTSDTHAVINNPRMGWDGWIYATHGYSASDDVRSGDGAKHFGRIGAGVVRFRPDGSAFEQYTSQGCNTWGLTITADNRVMWSQPTCGHLLMQTLLPETILARGRLGKTSSEFVILKSPKAFPTLNSDELPYVQIDAVGSFTAAAGCEIYDGGSWPAEYNGDFFTTEPTINIMHHERLTKKGVSYSASKLQGREETEFVRAKDLWFRPIEVRVGPDGALYVADFYNQAVIHNDTRGPDHNLANAAIRPDRDHYFGRIWRMDHKAAKKLEVPKLGNASVAELVKALEHPNKHVRMSAMQVLLERPNPVPKRERMESEEERKQSNAALNKNWGYELVKNLASDSAKSPEARIAALWLLGRRDEEVPRLDWSNFAETGDSRIAKNIALIGEEISHTSRGANGDVIRTPWMAPNSWIPLISQKESDVRVNALRGLVVAKFGDEVGFVPKELAEAIQGRRRAVAEALVNSWPLFDDDFQKSAAIAAAMANPSACIVAALNSKDSGALAPLIQPLIQAIADKGDAEGAAKIVVAFASDSKAVALQRSVLSVFSKSLAVVPKMTPELKAALETILSGSSGANALGIAVKWDQDRTLASIISGVIQKLKIQLQDGTADDELRYESAKNLLNTRSVNPDALPAVIAVAVGNTSMPLRKQIIGALAETGDASIGQTLVDAFNKLPAEVQGAAFESLLQRKDWSLALVGALESKALDIQLLKPADTFRLRTHADQEVAAKSATVLDTIQGSAIRAKSDILAKLTPEVEKPGDLDKGKALFTTTCAVCHKFGDIGTAVGPVLTGMGAHGPGELLIHIVDPNREVEPSYATWNIETKNGQYHAGAISRENAGSIILKSLAGEVEIKQADIKSRVNTGRSLMPEGFEGMGGEALRDILAFMCGGVSSRFRTVELKDAFTTDSRRGMFKDPNPSQGLAFTRFGIVEVGAVPFMIVNPEKSANGKNVIVLKGGTDSAASKKLPQKVEAKLGGFEANRLHFLGGIAGWGFKDSAKPTEAMKVTVIYSDQQTEEIICQDAVEFLDFLSDGEVPGSKRVNDLLQEHQIRWFTKTLKRTAAIDRIVLESPDNLIAPVTVAITAELAK